MPVILAHGALGAFDEIVFLCIALVFVGMMAFSWLRGQRMPAEDEEAGANHAEHFELE